MKRNRNFGSVVLARLVIIVIAVILVSATGAWAASTQKSLYEFSGGADGAYPIASLILDQSGSLYGTTEGGDAYGSGTAFKLTPNASGGWKESVLYSFCRLTDCTDGASPGASLIFDTAGNLYGTTAGGGDPACLNGFGCGVVFRLAPHSDGSWTESVLYSFCSLTKCADGEGPDGALIFDGAGNLYSTTSAGGIASCGDNGCGVVFELKPHSDGRWTESVLYSFCSLTKCIDGFEPVSGLVLDAAENLYGTTADGGDPSCFNGFGCGVVFKLDKTGKQTVLHRFTGKDGSTPNASVIFDQAGNPYGTTAEGGVQYPPGYGLVFQLTQLADGGWKENVLHYFTGGKDGRISFAGLIFDQLGNLYGTAYASGNLNCGGVGGGCGVAFRLAPSSKERWKETVLWTFGGRPGAFPLAGLIFDAAGNLYGTTEGGPGTKTYGSVFEIMP
jgi:uncharacterized repeat protein (TIGR03803 family)